MSAMKEPRRIVKKLRNGESLSVIEREKLSALITEMLGRLNCISLYCSDVTVKNDIGAFIRNRELDLV